MQFIVGSNNHHLNGGMECQRCNHGLTLCGPYFTTTLQNEANGLRWDGSKAWSNSGLSLFHNTDWLTPYGILTAQTEGKIKAAGETKKILVTETSAAKC